MRNHQLDHVLFRRTKGKPCILYHIEMLLLRMGDFVIERHPSSMNDLKMYRCDEMACVRKDSNGNNSRMIVVYGTTFEYINRAIHTFHFLNLYR